MDNGARGSWRADPLDVLDLAVKGISGEQRDGQRELASAVVDAMRLGHHLVAEAPTGSGKSLAYLAPAVASGLKVVVATSTIALQSQLVSKDLPALQRARGRRRSRSRSSRAAPTISACAKLTAAGKPDALFEQPVVAAFSKHLEHAATSSPRRPTPATAPSSTTRSPTRRGPRSAARASSARVAPTAPTATSASPSARANGRRASTSSSSTTRSTAPTSRRDGNVLPDHDVVIIDEAHSFADNATNTFGADLAAEVSPACRALLAKAGVDPNAVDAFAQARSRRSARCSRSREGRIDVGDNDRAQLGAALRLREARDRDRQARQDRERRRAKRTAQLAARRLEVLRRLGAPTTTTSCGSKGPATRAGFEVAPVSVGGVLGAMLLDAPSGDRGRRRPSAASRPSRAFADRLGFDSSAATGHVGRTNDDGRASRTPGAATCRCSRRRRSTGASKACSTSGNDLPDPRRANERGSSRRAIVCAARQRGRRALARALHVDAPTSNASPNCCASAPSTTCSRRATPTSAELSRSFTEDETSVLVGTRSFWAGIDVPGVACVLVVIDRIPFPSPGDPLHAARRERAEAAGLERVRNRRSPRPPRSCSRRARAGSSARRATAASSRCSTPRLANARLPHASCSRRCRRSVAASISTRRATFLKDAAQRVPKSRITQPASAAPVPVTEEDVFARSSPKELGKIRNGVACPDCGADKGERCHDEKGWTMAFLHDARLAAGAS